MAKEIKQLRKQAEKAARAVPKPGRRPEIEKASRQKATVRRPYYASSFWNGS